MAVCAFHPESETDLRCARCGDPICVECLAGDGLESLCAFCAAAPLALEDEPAVETEAAQVDEERQQEEEPATVALLAESEPALALAGASSGRPIMPGGPRRVPLERVHLLLACGALAAGLALIASRLG